MLVRVRSQPTARSLRIGAQDMLISKDVRKPQAFRSLGVVSDSRRILPRALFVGIQRRSSYITSLQRLKEITHNLIIHLRLLHREQVPGVRDDFQPGTGD